MKKFFSIASSVIIFIYSVSNAQTTISIRLNTQTGQSAYIADNYLFTPFPNHPDLISTSWSNVVPASARTLFQFYFDSIPTSAQIIDAKLSLFANPTPVNEGHFGDNESYIRRVTSTWLANSVLWEPQPDFTHRHEVLLPTVTSGQNLLNINVTDLVKDMIDNPKTSFGFILMLRFEYIYKSMNFASGVCPDTSKRPLLVITYDEPLPVELSSFTSSVNERNVTLNWTTSSEESNSGFEILRSSLSENSDWFKIGFVQSNGNSSSSHNYSYIDRTLSTGKYKYRLKQIDFNGNYEYYDLSNEVVIGIPQKFSLSQNYPNPFNPSTIIFYDIPQDGTVKLRIFDESGREIKVLVNEMKSAGYYTLDFNASNLSSGVYFYKLEFNPSAVSGRSLVDSKKMILLK